MNKKQYLLYGGLGAVAFLLAQKFRGEIRNFFLGQKLITADPIPTSQGGTSTGVPIYSNWNCPPAEVMDAQINVMVNSQEICLNNVCEELNAYVFNLSGVPAGSRLQSIQGAMQGDNTFLWNMGYSGQVYYAANMGTQIMIPGASAVGEAADWFGGSTTPPITGSEFTIFKTGGHAIDASTSLFQITLLGGNLSQAAMSLMIEGPEGTPQSNYILNFTMADLSQGGTFSPSQSYPNCNA